MHCCICISGLNLFLINSFIIVFCFSNRMFYCLFLSSTGTFISAFTVLCGARSELISERGVCCVFWLNVAAALIQILTAVIMVGWIMSIFWGMDMVILASQYLSLTFLFLFDSLLLPFSLTLFILVLSPFLLFVCLTHDMQ